MCARAASRYSTGIRWNRFCYGIDMPDDARVVSESAEKVSQNLQGLSAGAEQRSATIQSIASNTDEAATIAGNGYTPCKWPMPMSVSWVSLPWRSGK
jgi:hypothetical protein